MTKIYKAFPREKHSQFANIYPENSSLCMSYLHVLIYVYVYVHIAKNVSMLQNMDGSQYGSS